MTSNSETVTTDNKDTKEDEAECEQVQVLI